MTTPQEQPLLPNRMIAPATPPRPPIIKPPPQPQPPSNSIKAKVSFGSVGNELHGHRIVLYGPGGIGKTTLCASLPGPVAFFDIEGSLRPLRTNLEAMGLIENIYPVNGVETWSQLRNSLQGEGWESIRSIVIDSGTKAEDFASAHVLETVKTEKGKADSIESYGYGKGFTHLFETFLPLLQDMDRHSREGRNVILVCHDCTATVPNPSGEDWLRYEPRLQSPASGKASIRLRVREWADHVLFMGYDLDVDKEGKGRGAGTKTIYTSELPHCMAKSRSIGETIPLDGSDLWPLIIR